MVHMAALHKTREFRNNLYECEEVAIEGVVKLIAERMHTIGRDRALAMDLKPIILAQILARCKITTPRARAKALAIAQKIWNESVKQY